MDAEKESDKCCALPLCYRGCVNFASRYLDIYSVFLNILSRVWGTAALESCGQTLVQLMRAWQRYRALVAGKSLAQPYQNHILRTHTHTRRIRGYSHVCLEGSDLPMNRDCSFAPSSMMGPRLRYRVQIQRVRVRDLAHQSRRSQQQWPKGLMAPAKHVHYPWSTNLIALTLLYGSRGHRGIGLMVLESNDGWLSIHFFSPTGARSPFPCCPVSN